MRHNETQEPTRHKRHYRYNLEQTTEKQATTATIEQQKAKETQETAEIHSRQQRHSRL